MNSIPNPKQTNPHDDAVAALKQAYEQFGRADEQLTRVDEQVSKLEQDAAPHPSDPQQAHEQVGRADEQLARVDEQVSKLEQDAAPHSSEPQTRINTFHPAVPGDRPSRGGRAIRGFIGFLLAVCIGVAAFVWQSPFYGDAARQIIARWAPQLVPTSSLTLESPGLPAQPSPPTVQSAAAKTAPPQPAHLAQTAPEDVATTAAALSPESAQQLQSMARDLATVGQEIEQLKTSQNRTCGPRYQRLCQGRLPPRRASRCRRRREPQRSRRPRRGRRCPCASASSTMRGTSAPRMRSTGYEVDLLGLW